MGIFSGRRARRTAGPGRPPRGRATRPWERATPSGGDGLGDALSDPEVRRARHLLRRRQEIEAEWTLRSLLAEREATLPADDPRLPGTRLALGAALLAQRRDEEADAVFAAAVGSADAVHGADHPVTLGLRLLIVQDRLTHRRFAAAEKEARDLAGMYGRDPRTGFRFRAELAMARLLLARAYEATARHSEALAQYDAMLPGMTRDLGSGHLYVLAGRDRRAAALAMLGRYAEAEAEWQDLAAAAEELGDTAYPFGPQLMATTASGLGHLRNETDRPAEAEAVLRTALDRLGLEEPYGDLTEGLRSGLIDSLNRQGRHDEALAELAVWPDHSGSHSERLFRLAESLHGLARDDEAEAAATEARATAPADLGAGDEYVLRIRTLLAVLHADTGEMAAAADAWERHFGADHPRTRAARAACPPA